MNDLAKTLVIVVIGAMGMWTFLHMVEVKQQEIKERWFADCERLKIEVSECTKQWILKP